MRLLAAPLEEFALSFTRGPPGRHPHASGSGERPREGTRSRRPRRCGRHDRRRQHHPRGRSRGRDYGPLRRAGPDPDHGGIVMKRVVLAYSGGLDTSVAIKWMGEQTEAFVAIDIGRATTSTTSSSAGSRPVPTCAWCARPTGSRRSSSRRRSRRTRSTRGSTRWSRARPPADRPGGRQGRSRRRRRRRRPRMYRQGKRSGAPRSLRRPQAPESSRCSRRSANPSSRARRRSATPRRWAYRWRRSRRRIRSTRTSGDGRRSAVRWRIRGWRRRRTRSPGRPRPTIDPRSPPRSSSTSTVAGRSPSTADRWSLAELIRRIDELAGAYGSGRVDMIENRRVGIKSRELYEVPGALSLILAHQALEDLTLEREVGHFKPGIEQRWDRARLRRPLVLAAAGGDRRVRGRDEAHVTGQVRLRYTAGRAPSWAAARAPPCTTSGLRLRPGRRLRPRLRGGFVRLWGLPLKTWSARQGSRG